MVRAEAPLEVSVGTSSVLRSFWSAILWIRPLMLHSYRPSNHAGRASIAPLTLEGHLWACCPFWALSVELALLPSPRGSPMSMPLPSERLSSFWGMSFPLLRLCDRSLALPVELALLPSLQRVIYEQNRSLLSVWVSNYRALWPLRVERNTNI